MPNSEVKPFSADDSVAVCHTKVGNRQALKNQPKLINSLVFFCHNGGNNSGIVSANTYPARLKLLPCFKTYK
jgi:hypothetical protein